MFHISHLLFILNLNLTGHLVFYLANLHREYPLGQWQTACLNNDRAEEDGNVLEPGRAPEMKSSVGPGVCMARDE